MPVEWIELRKISSKPLSFIPLFPFLFSLLIWNSPEIQVSEMFYGWKFQTLISWVFHFFSILPRPCTLLKRPILNRSIRSLRAKYPLITNSDIWSRREKKSILIMLGNVLDINTSKVFLNDANGRMNEWVNNRSSMRTFACMCSGYWRESMKYCCYIIK